MTETIEIEGKHYEVTGHDHGGTPIIKGVAVQHHHKDKHGNQIFDKDGNPKISVHVSASPLQEPLSVQPGENE